MKISSDSIKYILFQRTEYLSLSRLPRGLHWMRRVLTRPPFYNLYVRLDAFFNEKKIQRNFEESFNREYSSISRFLPLSAEHVLDIGCGVAGIDVEIFQKMDGYKNTTFHLFDQTRTDGKIHYGFKGEGSFYNSLEVARSMLESNGVANQKIELHDVRNGFPIGYSYNLVISLIAWGFHFPVSTYLDAVFNSLKEGGVLVIDVRAGTDGIEAIRAKFGEVQEISSEGKRVRVRAVKGVS